MQDDWGRRKYLTATGAGAAALLAGCTGDSDSDGGDGGSGSTDIGEGGDDGESENSETESSDDSGMLQLAAAPIGVLDPVGGKGSSAPLGQMVETLLGFNNGDLPPEPRLATGFDVSDDGLTYTFELKEGVTFHNGDELTASDVVYSWRRLAESSNSRNTDDIVGATIDVAHEEDDEENVVPDSLALEAVDDYTFEFELSKPFHSTLVQISGGAFGIIPEGIVGDIEGYEGEIEYETFVNERMTGTGPFQFEERNQGSSLTATRFDDYHGSVANISGITWTVLESDSARYNRAMNKNLDVFEIPVAEFDPEKVSIESNEGEYQTGTYGPTRNDETLNYGRVTLLNTNYVLFNTTSVIVPARKAIAYAMNPHNVANNIFKGTATPGYNVTPPPVFPSYDGTPAGPESYDRFAQENYPYGYDEARIDEGRALMEEEGYGPDNLYEIEMLHFQTNAYGQFAETLRDKARAMHIDLTIEATPFSTMINRAVEGNFDIFTNSDGMEWPESDNFLRYFHSTASKESSFARWGQDGRSTDASERFNEAWQKYLQNPRDAEDAQEARNEAYLELELAHFDGVAQLPIMHNRGQRWWYDDIENLRMFGPQENQQYNDIELNR